MLGYLVRLRQRMEKVGFLPGDPLYRLVREAEDKVHHLSVELHYRSCGGRVGKACTIAESVTVEKSVKSKCVEHSCGAVQPKAMIRPGRRARGGAATWLRLGNVLLLMG